MLLRLPNSLHYPITITKLEKQPHDDVKRFDALFSYNYKTVVTEGNEDGDEHQVERTFPAKVESDIEGSLERWMIEEGSVIAQPGLEYVEIQEACPHDTWFGGMCARCCKSMDEVSHATAESDTHRARINMTHDNTALTVSINEATRAEEEAKRRLIAQKKLSLVVDLDQTIIHATVDPTVGEWQRDEDNPNHDAVKEVRAFQLVDDGPGGRSCWYYIKLRPGLKEFLDKVSKLYELHIYTMGTRAYAQHIADIIDVDRKIFGDRILSRDESGSLVAKNLQRLFPVDTKMVVIIDDRADVWNWNDNLIKVTPYDFFVGIGDINSSFLPKRPKIVSTPRATADATLDAVKDQAEGASTMPMATTNGEGAPETPSPGPVASKENDSASALDQLVSMGGGDNPSLLQDQTTKQAQAITAQIEDRPLMKQQLEMDDKEAAKQKEGENADPSSDGGKSRQRLLRDDDNELHHLEQCLRRVHTEFFAAYEQRLASAKGGRLAALRGGRSSSKPEAPVANTDLAMVPDVKDIMPAMKRSVLAGTVVVFSGVVPLGNDVQSSEVALHAKSFGAAVREDISKRSTTHVIAARKGTAKVKQALRRGKGKIKVVGTQWLRDSIVQWARQDEAPYRLHSEDSDVEMRSGLGEDDADDILSESDEPGSALDTDADLTENESGRPKIKLRLTTGYDADVDDIEGLIPPDIDEDSPIGDVVPDWDDINNELNDFMDSGDDESDVESVASGTSRNSRAPRGKRGIDEISGGDDETVSAEVASHKRQATGPPSQSLDTEPVPLSQSTAAGDEGSVKGEPQDSKSADDDDEDDWDAFDRDFEEEEENKEKEKGATGEE